MRADSTAPAASPYRAECAPIAVPAPADWDNLAGMRSGRTMMAIGLALGLWLNAPAGCGAVEATCGAGKSCVCEGAGSCEYDCPGGGCLAGLCVPLCPTPLMECGGTCVDPRFDPKHCGACGHLCQPNERCEAGACEARCPPGTLACGAACVDAQRDALHCGNCTTVCRPGQSGTLGKCQSVCAPFQVSCAGQCVSTMTGPLHGGGGGGHAGGIYSAAVDGSQGAEALARALVA